MSLAVFEKFFNALNAPYIEMATTSASNSITSCHFIVCFPECGVVFPLHSQPDCIPRVIWHWF